jgi:DNA (cytosine-5)-methyltransferase 1
MVLAERWPHVPNLGDMTTIADRIRAGEVPAPDVLVGGTPCQDFSLAGLRAGMKGKRGQLTLAFVELANVIDDKRAEEGKPPVIIVWENVPGVYSDNNNAFGNFLAALAGEFEAFEPGPRPAHGKTSDYWGWNKKTSIQFPKWSKHGCVIGRSRRLGWTTKDAQYFGVAQRRRRCFLVASARTDFDPTSVFLESGSVCRDSAPSREAWSVASSLTRNGVGVRGADDNQAQAQHLICMAHGQAGAEINDNLSPTLTCNHEQPIIFSEQSVKTFRMEALGQYSECDFASTIKARDFKEATDLVLSFPAQMTSTQYASADPDVSQTIQALNPTAVCYPTSDKTIRIVVRRITPVEAERLQGMPDNHTLIPVHKMKRLVDDEIAYLKHHCPDITDDMIFKMAKDGPRHKAIGNSMAVPVMRWLMTRILTELPVNAPQQSPSPAAKTVEKMTKKKRKTSKAVNTSSFVRPFLKWPGGKYAQLDQIIPFIGTGKRLIEPFVGAGSVFLNAQGFERYIGGDTSADLIGLYHALQQTPGALVDKARAMFDGYNSEKGYFDIREKFNRIHYTPLERAAALLYLNRHSYNGLMRYNLKGGFNSSYGKYKAPYFPADEMEAFSKLSPSCEFHCQSFVDTIRQAGEGDVLFCDPPYMPLPGKEGFTTYTGTTFTDEHQWQLLNEMVAAHQRGARVVATNSSNEKLVEAYRKAGFNVRDLFARRSMSCKGDSREIAIDIVATLGIS